MSVTRRLLIRTAGALALATPFALPALAAESWPSRPIKLIVPFAAGVTDKVSRVLGERLEKVLGQPVVIETKAGGGGTVGTRYAAQQAADGYTLLIGSDGLALNAALGAEDGFDPTRDLTPITPIVSFPFLLVTGEKKPYTTLADLIAAAKAEPGKLNYATNGVSTSSFLMGEALKAETGTDIVPIPYKGGSEQALALIAGDVEYAYLTTAFVQPYIRDGALKPLAIATRTRSPAYPDVPTVDELGYKTLGHGFTWFALFAPKGVPEDIRQKLATAAASVVAEPDFQATLTSWGGSSIGSTSQDLANLLASQIDVYRKQLASVPLKKS